MSKPTEKVFIAWGGNQHLARSIGEELIKHGFSGIVGGGVPTDMYIGMQVFAQIHQCTRAIILVESTHPNSLNPFSNNLMFEWGYLTAKMDPRKLHVFLLGESKKNLPSDLAGIWANEINSLDKTTDQIAQEVIRLFVEAASRPIDINKTEVFSRWNETKRNLGTYSNSPAYSEIECAHYLLHSVEVCYGYMEEEQFLALIETIKPSSSVLEFSLQIVKANITLFGESTGLMGKLAFDTFSELKSIFETKFDFTNQDKNLHLWLRYFSTSRLGLLYTFIMRSEDIGEEYKSIYFKKAEECYNHSLQALSEISETYPQETVYTKLYEGYIYRDFHRINSIVGDEEKAFQHISAAEKAHELFYLHFKQHYPNDGYLIKHFGKEYYLDRSRRLVYIRDPLEKKMIESAIRSFLDKLENESGRQHVVLKQIRLAFEGKKPQS
ncbi:MAG: TIR domain-containing protein [Thermoguttaceae bacterium]